LLFAIVCALSTCTQLDAMKAVALLLVLALTAAAARRVGEHQGPVTPAPDVCSSGKQQSPVNVQLNSTVCVRHGEVGSIPFKVNHHYQHAVNATVTNNGASLVVNGNFGFLTVGGCNPCDGQEYTVQSITFKAPAEHQLDGKQYAAEIQISTQKKGGTDALIESIFLYQQPDGGFLNSFLDKIDLFHAPSASGNSNTLTASPVDLKTLKEAYRGEYFWYKGSLDASPCTEGVTWVLYRTPVGVTKEQMAALTQLVAASGTRAVQPLNGRQVTWYRKRV